MQHTNNTSDVLDIFRKLRPDHKFIDDFNDPNVRDLMRVQNQRGAELLKDFGRPGWTSLEESLKNFLESMGL
jgi:hypothetical protein